MTPKSLLGLYTALVLQITSCAARSSETNNYCSVFVVHSSSDCLSPPLEFLNTTPEAPVTISGKAEILEDAFAALAVLQNEYFDAEKNTWPSAIDWTAVVVETIVSAMLKTLTNSLDAVFPANTHKPKAKANLIASFYDQIVSYYFGQKYLEIKDQAFDDMLWVVLGWIEATTFAQLYEQIHFPNNEHNNQKIPIGIDEALSSLPWSGNLWLPSFYSRAQIFWGFASHGWDDVLCHGGMNWNPRLETYKNAITNELWIAASISMYQYYQNGTSGSPTKNFSSPNGDPLYLEAAIRGYKWLMDVNMTNSQGLFVDGYHISKRPHGNIECDERDEMVYTYNQGVVLTGQRGLWTVTGSPSYLEDGHRLIQSVIHATGWNLGKNAPIDNLGKPGKLPPWKGLGRGGILEEQCDASGTCSQDGQTFKGIFFHHMTAFCKPLDLDDTRTNSDTEVDLNGFEQVKKAHATACFAYLGWVKHNAVAALKTKDSKGRFGMWWGAGIFGDIAVPESQDGIDHAAANTTDYRNRGTPVNDKWGRNSTWQPNARNGDVRDRDSAVLKVNSKYPMMETHKDPNDHGRGRTVETQVGGVALLRAYWELATSS
ncbi:hypothetical protein PT974_05966 [Cladobotryum mycophilum]|uniref:Glycosyl hydrolase n=1 Tax=Cladobotryum mycophilum TaxID=491253 RepID=A0ABR0SK94_9HYPO